jgi:signal transduction histidine kinase
MSLALANLIRNGIRFTPDGGRVIVRARLDDCTIVIEVEDHGIGIPEERLRRLFDRAWQAPPSAHHHSSNTLEFNSAGLSLGLSITRGIVEAHEGTIGITSEVGRGTRVTLRIPARRPDELEAA